MKIRHAILPIALMFAFPASHAVADSVTPISAIERGISVTIKGEVIRITDEDEFRLQDDTGSVLVYIGWRNPMSVSTGDTVTVEGMVDNDLINAFRPEVYARSITKEDGTVINLR
ncbi:NirD/YgiW/YdeI family stress tolerance protein [Marinobacter sp.]|uniref:NirD/YgiW/YdeI family stress tolerance protein n=1 Tax=Marinobacter sp. TaxID=50741 RepID=UPI003A9094EB